jgi:hypothetical protein
VANVSEWYEEGDRKFHIEVNVHNDTWGPLFGYRGKFDSEWVKVNDGNIPPELLPVRHERRE